MSTTTSTPTLADSPRRRFGLIRNPLGAVAVCFLAILVLVAVIGPFLVGHDPHASSLSNVFAPPSTEHLLGGDGAGRDVLARLVLATSISLAAAAVAVVVAGVIGITAGLIAGYRGGWFDGVASWFAGLLLALPAIIVLLAARAALGPSLWTVMVIFGVILSPSYYRVVLGATRAVREELYIDAARVAGLSDLRIIGRHVLSAVRAPVILLTAVLAGVAIGVQGSLDFLGLGDPSLPTWGSMLAEGFYNINRAPTLLIGPALAISLSCVALALLGSALRDDLERASGGTRSRTPWKASASTPVQPIRHDAAPAEPILEVADLSVAYRVPAGWKTVVDGISLNVARSEIHALIGESGSGKTQTAWSLLGLLPTGGSIVAGSIRFDGSELIGARASSLRTVRGRRIGYVPQEPLSNLDPSSRIGHQLVEPLQVVAGLSRRAASAKSLELLSAVGIREPRRVFEAYPHEISGGMAQRVLIAGAVSCEPDLLIADEPTTALDVTVQAEILELLRTLRDETGTAMLLVTHNFGVVADLADRVSVMRTGAIVETGSVTDVFSRPEHEYTRQLLGAVLDDAPPRETWVEPTGGRV
jgi:peptide/nickel transport system permease protein